MYITNTIEANAYYVILKKMGLNETLFDFISPHTESRFYFSITVRLLQLLEGKIV